jgi:F-type H+-transporting ATPase subunit epsilon
MAELSLEVATPDKLLVDEKVSQVEVPGKDGYMGILPGHAALISELAEGTLKYTASGQTSQLIITGGFVEVRDDKVRVLADSVKPPESK